MAWCGDPHPAFREFGRCQCRDHLERIGQRRHQVRAGHGPDLQLRHTECEQFTDQRHLPLGVQLFSGELQSVAQRHITQMRRGCVGEGHPETSASEVPVTASISSRCGVVPWRVPRVCVHPGRGRLYGSAARPRRSPGRSRRSPRSPVRGCRGPPGTAGSCSARHICRRRRYRPQCISARRHPAASRIRNASDRVYRMVQSAIAATSSSRRAQRPALPPRSGSAPRSGRPMVST